MKYPIAIFLLLLGSTAFASSTLDIGTEYRLRMININRADYGLTNQHYPFYYSQRALAHVGGRFSPNLEFMTQFQAIGVAGSTGSVSNLSVNPAQDRYPSTNFSPWIQLAYLKAKHLFDSNVDLTIGRQPIFLGDGLILADDDLGFTGVRLDALTPWYDIRANLFAFRPVQSFGSQNGGLDIYGVELTKPSRNMRYQLAVVSEHDSSGSTIYKRPSENTKPTSDQFLFLQNAGQAGSFSQFNFAATDITRTFVDGRVEWRLAEGGFLKGELAFQRGSVSRDASLGTSTAAALGFTPSVSLGGYSLLLSGGLYTRFSKYGPIEIHSLFGVASGDAGGGTDRSFHPSFGHRFDGLERSGFGEFYGASLYDAMPSASYNPASSTPSVSGLPPGNSGIRVIGAGVTTHPTSLISVGVDYFVYTAQESTNFSPAPSESNLGTEIDVGVGLAYTSYISFRATMAFFSPGNAYGAYTDKAQRFMMEAVGRF
jgi:hypothetical protein